MGNSANATTLHALSNGAANLKFSRSSIKLVTVVGVDLVLTLSDGSVHVLQNLALRSMVEPGLKVGFGDESVDAAALLAMAGKVQITEALAQTVQKDVPDTEAASNEPVASPDEEPPLPPPSTESGIVAAPLGAELSSKADLTPPAAPPAPAPLIFSAPAAPGAPPPPPPPADKIDIAVVAHNVSGQSVALSAGNMAIEGSGGAAGSDTDLTPAAQAAYEVITGDRKSVV